MPLASACSQFDRIDPKVKLFKVYRAARTVTHTHSEPAGCHILLVFFNEVGWMGNYVFGYVFVCIRICPI